MIKKRKAFSIGSSLTQGLEETVAAAKNHSGELRIEIIPISKIELDPDNPRKLELSMADVINGLSKDDPSYAQKLQEKKNLETLGKTIKDQGLINPILVYKNGDVYRLIAGERRTLASLTNGEKTIQAKILDGKPEQLKISLLQWIENVERADLSLWERLQNLEKIANSYLGAKNIILEDLTLEKFANIFWVLQFNKHFIIRH